MKIRLLLAGFGHGKSSLKGEKETYKMLYSNVSIMSYVTLGISDNHDSFQLISGQPWGLCIPDVFYIIGKAS